MTLQQCKYVLEIARCGSFNEAAKQLFVAQSSLSVSVKALEQELNIKIFARSANGVYLTEEGAEFARYAGQLVEQSEFVCSRYASRITPQRLCVSTQHYDFVADVFGKLLHDTKETHYSFSLREMKTYEIITGTGNGFSDVGIIAIKNSDSGIMERYLTKCGLCFTLIRKVWPHAYIRQEHPLADKKMLTAADLKDYPCLAYEQGEHSATFFMEEIGNTHTDKQVEISDRASLLNVLLNTDGYTVGTGIMQSRLNMGRIISVPYESEDYYTLGYILRTDKAVSPLTKTFIEMLEAAVKTDV